MRGNTVKENSIGTVVGEILQYRQIHRDPVTLIFIYDSIKHYCPAYEIYVTLLPPSSAFSDNVMNFYYLKLAQC